MPIKISALNDFARKCLPAVEQIFSLVCNMIGFVFPDNGELYGFIRTVKRNISFPTAGIAGQAKQVLRKIKFL